jgi:hypothetical protein
MANMPRSRSTVVTAAAGATLAGLLACTAPPSEVQARAATAPRHRCAERLAGQGPTLPLAIKAWEDQVRRHPRAIPNFRLACHQKKWGRPGQFVVVGGPRVRRERRQPAAAAAPKLAEPSATRALVDNIEHYGLLSGLSLSLRGVSRQSLAD